MSLSALQDARASLNASPSAHLYDYITDKTTREAIRLRTFGAGGGDAADFIQDAIDEGAHALDLPAGDIPLRSSVILSNVMLRGQAHNIGALYPYGSRGTVVSLWSETAKPFRCGPNPAFQDLQFYWPNQTDKPGAPTAYPPLISSINTATNLSGLDMHRCTAANAYDLIEAGGNETYNKAGQWQITHCRLNALRWTFNLNHMPDFALLTGTAFGWNLFGDELNHYSGGGAGAGSSFYLRPWAVDNSALFRIWGDASASQMATRSVDGLLCGNLMVWGQRTVLLVDGGRVTNTTLEGVFDGCQQLVRVINNGAVVDLTAKIRPGSYFYKFGDSNAAIPPMVEAINPKLCTISIEGEPVTRGELVRITGADVADVDVRLNARGFAKTTTAGTYYAAYIDAPNANVSIDLRAQSDAASAGGVTRHGVKLVSARSSRVRAQVSNCQNPIEVAASTGQHLVEGCVTTGTGGTKSLIAGPNVKRGACAFDKPEADFVSAEITTNTALTSNAPANIAYIDVGPGSWDVSIAPRFTGDTTTQVGYACASASLNATPALNLNQGKASCNGESNLAVFAGCGFITPFVPATRFVCTAEPTTRIYFCAQAGFANGAMGVHGRIEARLLK